jgi:transcription elongation factor B subunit 2
MYIRIKRQKLTVFLQVEPSDTVLEVKQKLQALVEQVRTKSQQQQCSLLP